MVLLLFLIFPGAAIAEKGETEKVYPLPIMELAPVISDRLNSRGFGVRRESSEMGRIQLIAVKSGRQLRIHLAPDSPLATHVSVAPAGGKQPDTERFRKLCEYIDGYIEAASISPDSASQSTPPVILSMIDAVVCVSAARGDREIELSGFIFDRNGLVLCTAHNLDGSMEIFVTLSDERRFRATLVKMDRHRDLVLLRVNSKFNAYISLEKSKNTIDPEEMLYAIGCSEGSQSVVHPGFVNGPPRKIKDLVLWQVNMEVLAGNSGSPVLDTMGRLVGMVKGRFRGSNAVGFLTPVRAIISFVTSE